MLVGMSPVSILLYTKLKSDFMKFLCNFSPVSDSEINLLLIKIFYCRLKSVYLGTSTRVTFYTEAIQNIQHHKRFPSVIFDTSLHFMLIHGSVSILTLLLAGLSRFEFRQGQGLEEFLHRHCV